MTHTPTMTRPAPGTRTKAVPVLTMKPQAEALPLDRTVVMTEHQDPEKVAAELTASVSHGQGISVKKLDSNGFYDLKQDPETMDILEWYRYNHPELHSTWDQFIRNVYILQPPPDRWYDFAGAVNEDKANPIIYLVNKYDLVYQLTYLITKSADKAQTDHDQYSLGIASQAEQPLRCEKADIRAEMDAEGDNYICRSIARAKYVQANAPEFFSPDHFNRTLGNELEFQISAVSDAADVVIPTLNNPLCRLYGNVSGNSEEGYILEFVALVNGDQKLKDKSAKQLSNKLSKALDFKITSVTYQTVGISTLIKAAVAKTEDGPLTSEQRLFVRLHREFIRAYGDPLLEETTEGFLNILELNETAYLHEKIDTLYDLYEEMHLLTGKGELTAEESANAARIQRAIAQCIYDVEVGQAGPRFQPGSRVGKYEIIEQRAQGGFGSIFLVRDMDFNRVCVMKFITQDRAEAANFVGELAATDSYSAQERAAGTARVLDRGFYADCLYMVQSFEDGVTLKDAWQQILQMSALQKRVLMQLVVQRVYKINLHKKIAHRDIKPENIIVPSDSEGKIALPPLPREVMGLNPSTKLLKEHMPGYFESAAVEQFQAEIVVIDLGNAAEDKTSVRVVGGMSVYLTICSVILGITLSLGLGTATFLTISKMHFMIPTIHLWGYNAAALVLLILALSFRDRRKKVIDGEPEEGPPQATIAYFCPHQHMWVTSLSDVYALGGMYYKMVAADRFFNGQIRCLRNMDASVALRMKNHGDLWKFRNYKLWPSYAIYRRVVTQKEIETLTSIDGTVYKRLRDWSVVVNEKELPELIEKGMPPRYQRYNPSFLSNPHRLRRLMSRETGWDSPTIERILDVVIPREVDERDEGCIMAALQYDLTERITLKELVNELNMINCGADNAELNYQAPWLGAGRLKGLFNSRLTAWLGKGYLIGKRALRWWFVDHFKEGLLLTIAALATGAGAYIENYKHKQERQQVHQLEQMLINEGKSVGIDVTGLSVDEMYIWVERYKKAQRHKGTKRKPDEVTKNEDGAQSEMPGSAVSPSASEKTEVGEQGTEDKEGELLLPKLKVPPTVEERKPEDGGKLDHEGNSFPGSSPSPKPETKLEGETPSNQSPKAESGRAQAPHLDQAGNSFPKSAPSPPGTMGAIAQGATAAPHSPKGNPAALAWEKVLEENLGDYYLPRYKADKLAGRPTAWDYVEDVPGLPRVLLIGDSISRAYTLTVREELKGTANVHRAPANCGDTKNGLMKLNIWLGDGKWDLIHFNFGIHDRNTSSEDYAKRLEALVVRLKRTGAKLVWASSTPLSEGTMGARPGMMPLKNEIASEIMKKHGIPTNDLYSVALPKLAEIQTNDGCHFKEDGNVLLGKTVAGAIRKELEQPTTNP